MFRVDCCIQHMVSGSRVFRRFKQPPVIAGQYWLVPPESFQLGQDLAPVATGGTTHPLEVPVT